MVVVNAFSFSNFLGKTIFEQILKIAQIKLFLMTNAQP